MVLDYPFIEQIIENPLLDSPILVMADNLEEKGDYRAAWLRWWILDLPPLVKNIAGFSHELHFNPSRGLLGAIALDLSWRFRPNYRSQSLSVIADKTCNQLNRLAVLKFMELVTEDELLKRLNKFQLLANMSDENLQLLSASLYQGQAALELSDYVTWQRNSAYNQAQIGYDSYSQPFINAWIRGALEIVEESFNNLIRNDNN